MKIEQELKDAKHQCHDHIKLDTVAFSQRVLSALNEQQPIRPPSRSRKKRLTLVISVSLAVLAIAGFTAAMHDGTYGTQTTVEKALQAAHFPVKQPTYIPFTVTQKWGDTERVVRSGASSSTIVTIVYANGRKLIEEFVAPTSSHMIRIPHHLPTVHLANGEAAAYAQRSGSLLWTQDDETYQLIVHPWNLLTVSEIIRIADSVR